MLSPYFLILRLCLLLFAFKLVTELLLSSSSSSSKRTRALFHQSLSLSLFLSLFLFLSACPLTLITLITEECTALSSLCARVLNISPRRPHFDYGSYSVMQQSLFSVSLYCSNLNARLLANYHAAKRVIVLLICQGDPYFSFSLFLSFIPLFIHMSND